MESYPRDGHSSLQLCGTAKGEKEGVCMCMCVVSVLIMSVLYVCLGMYGAYVCVMCVVFLGVCCIHKGCVYMWYIMVVCGGNVYMVCVGSVSGVCVYALGVSCYGMCCICVYVCYICSVYICMHACLCAVHMLYACIVQCVWYVLGRTQ